MGMLKLLLIAASVAAAPPVELSTLSGKEQRGELLKLDAAALTFSNDGGESTLPLADLLGVRFTSAASTRQIDRKLSRVLFVDGTRFGCSSVTATGRKAVLESPQLGKVEVPRSAVMSIRFDPDPTVDKAWQELLDRRRKRDLLVIKKKGDVVVLDFLEGIVGAIDKQEIQFLFGGDEISVRREKVFGVIYAEQKAPVAKSVCALLLNDSVRLEDAGRLEVVKISWDGKQMTATLSAGGTVKIALEAIRELDFSLGKIRYLSQMQPHTIEYTDFWDRYADAVIEYSNNPDRYQDAKAIDALVKSHLRAPFDNSRPIRKSAEFWFVYQQNRDFNGRPIRIGKTEYASGLAIHSRTKLVYRLSGAYRRFRAVIGIEQSVARLGLGDVHVVISDATDRNAKKVLFEADIRGADKPREFDLDVSMVRDLEILVDFGDLRKSDTGDRLCLGDARLVK